MKVEIEKKDEILFPITDSENIEFKMVDTVVKLEKKCLENEYFEGDSQETKSIIDVEVTKTLVSEQLLKLKQFEKKSEKKQIAEVEERKRIIEQLLDEAAKDSEQNKVTMKDLSAKDSIIQELQSQLRKERLEKTKEVDIKNICLKHTLSQDTKIGEMNNEISELKKIIKEMSMKLEEIKEFPIMKEEGEERKCGKGKITMDKIRVQMKKKSYPEEIEKEKKDNRRTAEDDEMKRFEKLRDIKRQMAAERNEEIKKWKKDFYQAQPDIKRQMVAERNDENKFKKGFYQTAQPCINGDDCTYGRRCRFFHAESFFSWQEGRVSLGKRRREDSMEGEDGGKRTRQSSGHLHGDERGSRHEREGRRRLRDEYI